MRKTKVRVPVDGARTAIIDYGQAEYWVLDSGALRVLRGSRTYMTYSPIGWLEVWTEDDGNE